MNKHDIHPPSLARKMLLSFLRADFAEDVLGDLDEKFYSTVKDRSPLRARLNYWFQVLSYLRPFAIRKYKNQTDPFIMYGNYLKVGWRNMLRNKSYVAINTLGLVFIAGTITTSLVVLKAAKSNSVETLKHD